MKPRNLSNDEMVKRWISGQTFTSMEREARVSRTRIGQIIRGVLGKEEMVRIRKAQQPPNSTLQRKFSATNLDAGVKEALRQHVKEKGTSMSKFIAEAIEEKLDDLGVKIEKKPPYKGEPLPFEAGEMK